jgi:hypothetical protein
LDTILDYTNRQPILPPSEADDTSGAESSLRSAGLSSAAVSPDPGQPGAGGSVAPRPAGSIRIFSGSLSAVLLPLSAGFYGQGYVMPGRIYAVMGIGALVLFVVECIRETIDARTQAERVAERIKVAAERSRISFARKAKALALEADMARSVAEAVAINPQPIAEAA